jgi:DNA-directed RNA polymerase specialized sigma24 family protein
MRREVDAEFVEFVRARQHRLLRAAWLVCGDTVLAEDAVRRALAELAGRWERVRGEDPELVVRRSVYREAIAAGRRRQREAPVVAGELATLGLPHTDLLLALDTLTPRQRAILVLRFFDDRGEPEAADILGLSSGTVRAQARAATQALRSVLPERAGEEPRSDVS